MRDARLSLVSQLNDGRTRERFPVFLRLYNREGTSTNVSQQPLIRKGDDDETTPAMLPVAAGFTVESGASLLITNN